CLGAGSGPSRGRTRAPLAGNPRRQARCRAVSTPGDSGADPFQNRVREGFPMRFDTIERERVHLRVAEARALSERAMQGIGYDPAEARILADHVIDAALCGYEYSGLPKLLNVADHPRFKLTRGPMRIVRETGVSALFDGGNQTGMLGMYY